MKPWKIAVAALLLVFVTATVTVVIVDATTTSGEELCRGARYGGPHPAIEEEGGHCVEDVPASTI